MNAKEIAKQYKKNRLKVLPLLEELVEQFKKDKSSLDIQQLRLITKYLIWDREFDEDYIDELEKDISEMYYKVVVLDILQDELNISRDEAIEILENYYKKGIKYETDN